MLVQGSLRERWTKKILAQKVTKVTTVVKNICSCWYYSFTEQNKVVKSVKFHESWAQDKVSRGNLFCNDQR